jgi:lipopolysaccharide transport system permease protein
MPDNRLSLPADGAQPVPMRDADEPTPSMLMLLRSVSRDLVTHHELLRELTARDLRIRYKQTVMGVLWAILTPLVVVLAGAIVKAAFVSLSGRPLNAHDLAGLAIKSAMWTFFIGSLGFGTASLTANLALVTKVYFPRELLPISTIVTQGIDSAIGAVALLVLLPLFGIGHLAGIGWLLLTILLLVLFTTAVVLCAACANVYFRDVKHVVQLVSSFGIFFSPVFLDLDAFGPRGVRMMALNPLTGLFEGARLALVEGHDLSVPIINGLGAVSWSPTYLAWSAVCAIVGVVCSMVIFRRSSLGFADAI